MYDVFEHRVVLLEILTERINEALLVFFQSTNGVQLLKKSVVAREDATITAGMDNYLRPELFKAVLLCQLGLGVDGGGSLADIKGGAVVHGRTIG